MSENRDRKPGNGPKNGKSGGGFERKPRNGTAGGKGSSAYGRNPQRSGTGTRFSRKPSDRPFTGESGSEARSSFRGERPAQARSGGSGRPGDARRSGNGRPQFRGKPFERGNDRRNFPGNRTERGVRPQRPPEDGLKPRRVALTVIREVTERGAWASLILNRELVSAGLSPLDRRLAARLAYDTLDRLMYLDAALSQVMAREDTDIRLRNILRLGACQLLLEDRIPDMAATDTSVQLCQELGMEGLKGVCNGILRNLIRKKDELVFPDPVAEPEKSLSVVYSMPGFLVGKFVQAYGLDETAQIVAASGRNTSVTLRRNALRMTPEQFEALLSRKVWTWEKGPLPDAWKVKDMANPGEDADFLSGNFSIQSMQSQMACLALAPRRGWTVLDACAAPGGKSCYLSELMGGTGRVQAWDKYEHRVALIEAQVKRLGLDNVRPMVRDAGVFREDLEQSMDAVLLDAPCSGTGEMHEKPDSRYRLTPERLEELRGTQAAILSTVCRYVKKGGVLVYATCSILPEENEEQVRAFLEAHPEFEAEAWEAQVPEAWHGKTGLGVQLVQGLGAEGGFYICRMRRKRV